MAHIFLMQSVRPGMHKTGDFLANVVTGFSNHILHMAHFT